jgi:hypothetical protein
MGYTPQRVVYPNPSKTYFELSQIASKRTLATNENTPISHEINMLAHIFGQTGVHFGENTASHIESIIYAISTAKKNL